MSLFPQRPASQRAPRPGSTVPTPSTPPTRPGGGGSGGVSSGGHWGLLQTLLGALAAPFEPGEAARSVSNRLAIRQVFFTGFEALPLVSVIAFFVGATIVLQMQIMAVQLPGELVGRIIVATVLRELAPLVTAIIVTGRSGTAIATELGNMKADSEFLALSSLGIDPLRFIVWPRMVGAILSVMVLTVYFGMIAILSGYVIGAAIGTSTFSSLQAGFAEAIVPEDLFLYLAKCGGLGLIVGWLSCHYGLEVQGSPTEVPQKASKAVIRTLLAAVIYNTVVTAGFYMVVGPPIR